LLEWAEAKAPGIVDRFCSQKRVWEDGQGAADGRPRIIPGDRLDSEIHQELGRIIGPKNQWFRFGRTLVAIRKVASGFTYSSDPEEKYRRSAYITGIAGLSAIDAANEIERYVEPGFIRKDSEGQLVFVPRSLSREFCERLIVSDVFLNTIPDLSKILSVPIPMLYKGALTYPKPGYDPRFKTFLRPDAPKLEEISFKDAVSILKAEVFGGFCFVREQSMTHALSRLITIFARGLLPSWSTRTPLWSYWGNRPRAGKDYCATIPNILLDGFACEQQPIGKDSAETAKRLMAANLAGAQVLHFSNCQGYLDDAAFTQAITAPFISARQLGSNSANAHQGAPNLADYSISLNVGSTCREDLVARSRPIELAFYSEDPNSRTFPKPDLHGWIVENRSRIISAIFALFKRWTEKGCPEGPRKLLPLLMTPGVGRFSPGGSKTSSHRTSKRCSMLRTGGESTRFSTRWVR
jgi:hypothetical protein